MRGQTSEGRYSFELVEVDTTIFCDWKLKLSKFSVNNDFLNLLHRLSILFESIFLRTTTVLLLNRV